MLEAQGFDSEHLDDDVKLLEVRRQLIAPTAKKLGCVRAPAPLAEEKFRARTWANPSEMQCKQLKSIL